MKKFVILAILVIILLLAEGAGVIYFAHKNQGLSNELKESTKRVGELDRVLKDKAPLNEALMAEKQKVEQRYKELLKEHEILKADRDNVLIQTKRLLSEKKSVREYEGSLNGLKTEVQKIESEKAKVLEENKKLQGQVEQLMSIQDQMRQEKVILNEEYAKIQRTLSNSAFQKKLDQSQNEIAKLEQENRKMQSQIKEMQNESKRTTTALLRDRDKMESNYEKAQAEVDDLMREKRETKNEIAKVENRIFEYKEQYKDALKKNKCLETELRNVPKKFSELARQNTKLRKETSRMHYNLGVFYTKHQDYERSIVEFQKALEIDPDIAYGHFNLGYIYAEYLVNREKAIEHFRHFLRLAKDSDEDVDWVKKYLLTWETYEGKSAMD